VSTIHLVTTEAAGLALGVLATRIDTRLARPAARVALALVVAAASIAALFAHGAPTGSGPLDALGRAALVGLCALAATRARPSFAVVAGIVAALAATGPWQLLAFGVTGLAIAALTTARSSPLLAAVGGAALGHVGLHLQRPAATGGSALVAAFVVGLLVVPTALSLPGRSRRRLLLLGTAGVAGMIMASSVALAAALWARGPLERGTSVLAGAATSIGSPAEREGAAARLDRAGRDFGRAQSILGNVLVRPVAAVPLVAQQWRVLHAAALSGKQLADASGRAARGPAAVDLSMRDGRIPLEQLAAIAPSATDVSHRLEAASHRLAAARSPWLVPPLARRLAREYPRIATANTTAAAAAEALPQLRAIFGAAGPRRYLLIMQTPAEGRATGGFIGNFGEISAVDGRLSLDRIGRNRDLDLTAGSPPRQLTAPEDYIERYDRFQPQQRFDNVNVSPDFPTVAGVIAGLYPQAGGSPIDGVVAVDPAGLAALLGVVGPVSLPAWPVPLTPDNALDVLLKDQYAGLENPERVDFLASLTQEVWRRLTGPTVPSVEILLRALGPAVRDKHVMVAATRPSEEHLYQALGVGGAMAPVRGDFLGVITQNAGGNKLDAYLRRDIDYRVQLDPADGRLVAHVRVTLHNDAPPDLPRVVLGTDYFPDLPPGDNKMYLSVYSPWPLLAATLDGAPVTLESAAELGRQVYSAGVVVPSKGSVTVELTLRGRLSPSDSYRLDVHRQPTAAPDQVGLSVELPGGWVTSGGERRWSEGLKLDADASVDVDLRRR
jgi:hypothetical protein